MIQTIKASNRGIMGQLLLLLLLVGVGARQEVVRREVGVREVRVEEKGRVVREVGERGWMEREELEQERVCYYSPHTTSLVCRCTADLASLTLSLATFQARAGQQVSCLGREYKNSPWNDSLWETCRPQVF